MPGSMMVNVKIIPVCRATISRQDNEGHGKTSASFGNDKDKI